MSEEKLNFKSKQAKALWKALTPEERQLLKKDCPFRHERNALILELRARGVSSTALAEVAGVSQTAIVNKVKKSIKYWKLETAPVLDVDFHPVLLVYFSDTMKEKYRAILNSIDHIPSPYSQVAIDRFILIKIYEDIFLRANRELFRKKFRAKQVNIDFCRYIHVPVSTFCRWIRTYKKLGIEGLVPRFIDPKRSRIDDITVSRDYSSLKRPIKTIITIDPNNPFKIIQQLVDFVQQEPGIKKKKKQPFLRYLDRFLKYGEAKYFIPKHIHLKPEDIPILQRYKARNHKRHSSRAIGLLMTSEGNCLYDIAVSTGYSPQAIQRWIRNYKNYGISIIETKMTPEKHKKMWEERCTKVIDILHTPPNSMGINRTSWTYDTIIQVYKMRYKEDLPKTSLKRIINETGYTWRHARQVLTSPDPDYQKKVEKVLNALRATKEDEAFFFVDELGPYAVKKYGGKALASKETTRTVPSKQKPKGSVQAIGALEAFTNQLTWIFIEGKDVPSVLLLLNTLRKKYKEKKKIIITWDTLSTHNAKEVKQWIKENNKRAKTKGSKPKIKIIPLPSKSQFLNVIESVFRGMKTAVIHNSDYQSQPAMESAIDRHFKERNAYFEKNPKRVGNKIWDKEAFDTKKLRGGLFKKM